MFRRFLLLGGLVSLTAISSDNSNEGYSLSVARFVDQRVIDLLDEYNKCSHNDGNSLGVIDPQNFNSQKINEGLRSYDQNKSCKNRIYSKSKEQAIQLYNDFVTDKIDDSFSEYAEECLKEEIRPWAQKDFKYLLTDPKNLGVFASLYNSKSEDDDSEGCAYYEFFIYRASGDVARFVFNYTE